MLTENQKIIYSRLLDLLKFDNSYVRENYFRELAKLQEQERIYYLVLSEYLFKSPKSEQDLVLERRKIKDYAVDYKFSNYVSASEISDYSFCPASFCISKSFKKIKTKEMKAGIDLHSENRLVKHAKKGERPSLGQNAYAVSVSDERNAFFFHDITSSEVNYLGHTVDAERLFSSKGNFVGQPDYIFKNANGETFIVEEKFKYIKQSKNDLSPWQSHKLQLSAYLFGLESVNAAYGYLVYWIYDYINEKPIIKRCNVLKIDKNQQHKGEITRIYKDIIKLKSGYEIPFNINDLNAVKCVSCSVAKFCSHKTETFGVLSLPYSEEFYGVKKYIEFRDS